jgi:hypothetical protein
MTRDTKDRQGSAAKGSVFVKRAVNVAATTRLLRSLTGRPVAEIAAAVREGRPLAVEELRDPMTVIRDLHGVGADCEIEYRGEKFDIGTPERREAARRRDEAEVKAIEDLLARRLWLEALSSLPLTPRTEDSGGPSAGDWSSVSTHRNGEELAERLAALSKSFRLTVGRQSHLGMSMGIRIEGSCGVTSFDTSFFRTGAAEWQQHYKFYSD